MQQCHGLTVPARPLIKYIGLLMIILKKFFLPYCFLERNRSITFDWQNELAEMIRNNIVTMFRI
jgi:hypothetical protein